MDEILVTAPRLPQAGIDGLDDLSLEVGTFPTAEQAAAISQAQAGFLDYLKKLELNPDVFDPDKSPIPTEVIEEILIKAKRQEELTWTEEQLLWTLRDLMQEISRGNLDGIIGTINDLPKEIDITPEKIEDDDYDWGSLEELAKYGKLVKTAGKILKYLPNPYTRALLRIVSTGLTANGDPYVKPPNPDAVPVSEITPEGIMDVVESELDPTWHPTSDKEADWLGLGPKGTAVDWSGEDAQTYSPPPPPDPVPVDVSPIPEIVVRAERVYDGWDIYIGPKHSPAGKIYGKPGGSLRFKDYGVNPELPVVSDHITLPDLENVTNPRWKDFVESLPESIPDGSTSLGPAPATKPYSARLRVRPQQKVKTRTRENENRRRKQETKHKGMRAYIALLMFVNRTWGRVSELFDAYFVIVDNIYFTKNGRYLDSQGNEVTYYKGMKVGDLDWEEQAEFWKLYGNDKFMHDLDVDFQGLIEGLLVEQVMDHAIGKVKQWERQAIAGTGWDNAQNPSTMINRATQQLLGN